MTDKIYCANIMEAQLRSHLNKHKVTKGEPWNHTTKIPSGVYFVGDDALDAFMTMYCNAISKGVRPTVTEKPGVYGPCRADFDLKAAMGQGTERQYTEEMVTKIIGYYQEEIKALIDEAEFNDRMLYAILLEKPGPRVENGIIKDGFHLHFPHFICEGWIQDSYLRNRVNEKMVKDKLWGKTLYTEPVDKFIDVQMATKPWLMYGSTKDPKIHPFLVTRAYDADTNQIDLSVVFDEEMVGRKQAVTYYLPRLMSVRGFMEATALRPETEKFRTLYQRKPRKVVIQKKRPLEDVLTDLQTIKEAEFMSMLSDERADDYSQWLDVGWTLFCISGGQEEGLQMWIDFSKRSDKFQDGVCEEKWSKMTVQGKTLGSLRMMARIDSPDRYKEWSNTNLNTVMRNALVEPKPAELDIAKVVHCKYRDRFICSNARKDIWYEFRDHRWHFMDDGITIRRILGKELIEDFCDLKKKLADEIRTKADSEAAKAMEHDKRALKIVSELKTSKFHEKVLKMCKLFFHDPKFEQKLDENKKLFVCENGVLDLELGLFRDGRPDDFCSMSCQIEYPQTASREDDEVKDVDEFFRRIFTNAARRDYFLDIASSCLQGGNIYKTLLFNTGDGDNGKSLTFTFMEKVFGDYCFTLNRELLIVSKGNSSGSARPDLISLKGRRLVVGKEVAKTETLNIGVLKELTGNDSINARDLYQHGKDMKNINPSWTLMIQCNEPPKIPGDDEAMWNRLRVLEYDSKFVRPNYLDKYPVPVSEDEQFKMRRFKADLEFGARLPELASALLWLLFERFKNNRGKSLHDPPEVSYATNMYRSLNDVYMQFLQDRVQKVDVEKKEDSDVVKEGEPKKIVKATKRVPDPAVKAKAAKTVVAFLTLTEIYEEFVSWFHENHQSYARGSKTNKIALKHELTKKLGPIEKKGVSPGWFGYQIINEVETDERQTQLNDLLAGRR